MDLQLWLIRHGETEWSLSGAHTSRTDIPLTARGEERATRIRDYLAHRKFSLVLTSPMQRARETCRLAGYGEVAQIEENLREWDYGIYEGRTTAEIRKEQPDWSIWDAVPPQGEPVEHVAVRAQQVIDRAAKAGGDVALFAHAHVLRILAVTWVGLPPRAGSLFALGTGSVSTLGYERETRVISTWNRSLEE
ncbi:MAG TPA: histidine phosphatase family protein [Acidobacteriaceae bacterium]|nr:histidine phosphatase family protein [Acidobacteriaceae bacterium]